MSKNIYPRAKVYLPGSLHFLQYYFSEFRQFHCSDHRVIFTICTLDCVVVLKEEFRSRSLFSLVEQADQQNSPGEHPCCHQL